MRLRFRRGTTAVEYGLTLPVIASFMLFVLEGGLFYYQQAAMSTAVRHGCELAATHHIDDTGADNPTTFATTYVKNSLMKNLGIDCDAPEWAGKCEFTMAAGKDTAENDQYRIQCYAKVRYTGVVYPLHELDSDVAIHSDHHRAMEFQD